jgi:hypothetical protein
MRQFQKSSDFCMTGGLRLEGQFPVAHDGVAGDGIAFRVVVAVMGSAAFVAGERRGNDDGGDGV